MLRKSECDLCMGMGMGQQGWYDYPIANNAELSLDVSDAVMYPNKHVSN